ncbi:MAG: formylglycine-generating enzyme family protein [Thermodesulfobacteriota bacterium]
MKTAAATNINLMELVVKGFCTLSALLLFFLLSLGTTATGANIQEESPPDNKKAPGNHVQEGGGETKRGLAPFVETLLKRYGVPDEYLDSGEPRCSSCHTSEMRPAIDYTTDAECLQCHNADYSERFLEIDERYKVPLDEATESYRQHIRDDLAQLDRPTPSKEKKTYAIPDGMVLIPAGEFIMGTNDWWPKSGPEHKRTLPDFFMDIYEVTNRDYMEFVVATGHNMPDHWRANKGMVPPKKYDHPVTYVNWFDADAYCKWRGKRLPTEAEWEKAARGTDGRVFPWGNKFEKNRGNTPQYGKEDTMPVGSFDNGKSPYGVHDLAGNVFEWTADWYMAYPGNKHPDPNEGERYRVVRGGSWYDCTYYKCGISAPTYNRIFFNPYTRNNNFGFRCVQDAK